MLPVTVFPRQRWSGVRRPGYDGPGVTYDWRILPGERGNSRRVLPGEMLDLTDALTRRWSTDAHVTAYVVWTADGLPLRRPPRVCKDALPWIAEQGLRVTLGVLLADVDNPGRVAWTPDAVERTEELLRGASETLHTCGYYYTAGGYRLVQPLEDALDAGDRAERVLDAWHDALEAAGVVGLDRSCRDWTRFYRAPWVVRLDGKRQQRVPVLDGMRSVPAPEPRSQRWARRPVRRGSVAGTAPATFATSLPPEWVLRAEVLALAVARVEGPWHPLFLALAGALCEREVPAELVPALCGAVSATTRRDDRTEDRVLAGRSTVQRRAAGEALAGYDALLLGWPEVAAALDVALATRPAPELPSAEDAAAQLRDAIRRAGHGVSVMVAGCGVGKTRAFVDVALERAAPGRHPSGRTRLGTRTTLSVPTNALARQVADSARARGLPVLRLYSPPSELDADGRPLCVFADALHELAAGHLSARYEACEGRQKAPCPHRATCPVADGQEGDPEALVVVGNHGLLPALVGSAGATGLLGIDEPPPLLETIALGPTDFAVLAEREHALEDRYATALRPLARALGRWLQQSDPTGDAYAVRHAVGDGLRDEDAPALLAALEATGEAPRTSPADEALAAARAAVPEKHRAYGPPVRWGEMARARFVPGAARELGRATRVAHALWRAATQPDAVVRVDLRAKVPTLLLTLVSEPLMLALQREGATVVLDATPDLPVLERAAGYSLAASTTRVWARDGAPIARTHLYWAGGSRRHLLDGTGLRLDALTRPLEVLAGYLLEDPECARVGLVTLLPLRLVLEHVLYPDDPRPVEAWRARHGTLRFLAEARETLGPALARWPGSWMLGHYGAVRGLDHMASVDALVTLADPWPQLADARHDAGWLGIDSEGRLEQLARAELQQAHGRLRTPHRTRPGRAIHLGRVVPSGSGWDRADVRELPTGRPTNPTTLDPETLRGWIQREARGSIRYAAKLLGVTHPALHRYLKGERQVPAELATRVQSGTETPSKNILARGFGTTPSPEESAYGGFGTTLPLGVSVPPAYGGFGTADRPSSPLDPPDLPDEEPHDR